MMGHEFWYICHMQLQTRRRLIWVIGVVFTVAVILQNWQLPYDNVFSSLFFASSGKIQEQSTSASFLIEEPSHSPTIMSGNLTSLTFLNSTGRDNNIHGIPTTISMEENTDLKNVSVSERHNVSVVFLDLSNKNEAKDHTDSIYSKFSQNVTVADSSRFNNVKKESRSVKGGPEIPLISIPQTSSPPQMFSSKNEQANTEAPVIFSDLKTPSMGTNTTKIVNNNSSMTNLPTAKKKIKDSIGMVVSISAMNNLLLQSYKSLDRMMPRWPSAVDQELLDAKSQIDNAPVSRNDQYLYAPLYRNISIFKRSYELMEQMLKVYIYREGDRRIFHKPVLRGIYASEGWFMKLLEANRQFVTNDPGKAHLFFLPFSSVMLEQTLYVANSHSLANLADHLSGYLDMIMKRYPFWNRTDGTDHFLAACHDWAPWETKHRMGNCIRALCNADIKEGFQLGKDASLPETYVHSPKNPFTETGGKVPSTRHILAFFAGQMHGYLRPLLLQYWENKDPDMKISGKMRKVKGQMDYVKLMKSSKYCICPRGYEVNSPRVVEAILYECVPVIISDNFVPPFFEVLNWESFAVFVLEKDIPNLKQILLSISPRRYRVMQQRVKQVQRHFLWNSMPVKYDIFHMILHSIWYNRVYQAVPRR